MPKRLYVTLLLTAALMLGACGPVATGQRNPTSANRGEAVVDRPCLLAAAESYEALTERASVESFSQLRLEARDAETTARRCKHSLNSEQSAALYEVFDRVNQAQNPSAFALAAVEGYRILVTAHQSDASPVPIEVALLDYAGFRYQAGASAPAPLWNDMREAASIAERHWASIAPGIANMTLKQQFSDEIAAMRAAIEQADIAAARRAVAAELDDVDRLEQHFSDRTHQ